MFWTNLAARCSFDDLHIVKEGICKEIWKNIVQLVSAAHRIWPALFSRASPSSAARTSCSGKKRRLDDEPASLDDMDTSESLAELLRAAMERLENAQWDEATVAASLAKFDGSETARCVQTTKEALIVRLYGRIQAALAQHQSSGRRLLRKLCSNSWTAEVFTADEYVMLVLALPAVIGCKGAVIPDPQRESQVQLLLANVSRGT